MIKLLATAVAAAAISLTACQPPPPPAEPDKVCDWITESEWSKVREGMTLWQVKDTLGKELDLTSSYTINYSYGPVTYTEYEWDQTWDENGCSQWVTFDFENGVYSGYSFWSRVVK